jgi:DNA polymerase-1
MVGAATGRLSSNDPNLQNIPVRTEEGRKIRTAFVAEPGNVLLSVDYSQIELRLVADIAGIESLRQAFLDGKDIHAQTASEVFGVPLDEMTPETRRRAKAINFGIIYGISGFGLARQLSVPQGEAQAYINAYFERFPGIRDYMDSMKAFAREHGFVETKFGRKVHIQAIRDKNPAMRSFGERAAINAPIQGTAADVIKRAMVRLRPALEKANSPARMLLQVHDELVFEVPEDAVEATAALVREVMEGAAAPTLNLSVPLVADAGWGKSWAEAH